MGPQHGFITTQARIRKSIGRDDKEEAPATLTSSSRVASGHTPLLLEVFTSHNRLARPLRPSPPRDHGGRRLTALPNAGRPHPRRARERPDPVRRAHRRAVLPVGLDARSIHREVQARVRRRGGLVGGRLGRRRDARGIRRVRVDRGGPARSSSRASSQAARRPHDTHARDSRAGAISSWPLGSSQVLTLVAPDLSAPRLCAISPPRTCSPRPPWTPPRASTPGGSASTPCSSRYSAPCTPRSLTRSSYHRQGEVSSSTCFFFR